MPKATKKSKRAAPPEDESDEEMPAASQVTQTQSLTQADKAMASVAPDIIDRKVCDLVQYLLIVDHKKLPIRRQEINKNVLKEHSKAFPHFMKKAKDKLELIFGIDLVELEGKQKAYILVNMLDNDVDHPHQKWPPEDNCKMGLVMIILSLIFMKGNIMQDTLLYHTLKQFGVDVDLQHEVFHDVKRMITGEFVRHGYLEYIRVPTSDPPSYEFQWGLRAKQETTKRNVLDFVCQIYGGDVGHQHWPTQLADVERTEGMVNGDAEIITEEMEQ